MKRWIVIASLVLFSLSCGKGIDTLPCERGNYGVVDILNSSEKTHFASYCRVDHLAEEENCEGILIEIKPHLRGAVRLRLTPGEYQIVIQNWKGSEPILNAWSMTVKRCGNIYFRIEPLTRNDTKVSLWDQPYHHIADKAKITERNSVIPEGLE